MHRFKWEWDSLTTFNQFAASFVHPFRSKNVRSIVVKSTAVTDTDVSIERVNLALYDGYVVTGPSHSGVA
jgi:hypothetical protein